MRVSSLGLRTDLMVRRLAGSEIQDHATRLVVRTPPNPGFYWGNFLVMSQPLEPGGAEEWRVAFEEAFPGARHRAFAVDGTDGEIGDPAELSALGVEADVSTVLTAAAPLGLINVQQPQDGPECRLLATEKDWLQLVALRGITNAGAGGPEQKLFEVRRVAESRALAEAGHAGWVGTFDAGDLVAALGVVSDGSGLARYQNVETHPDYRRQGLARQLLQAASGFAAHELDVKMLVIVADPDYHAIDLYRSMGFVDHERQVQLQTSR